eukprot:1077921_1
MGDGTQPAHAGTSSVHLLSEGAASAASLVSVRIHEPPVRSHSVPGDEEVISVHDHAVGGAEMPAEDAQPYSRFESRGLGTRLGSRYSVKETLSETAHSSWSLNCCCLKGSDEKNKSRNRETIDEGDRDEKNKSRNRETIDEGDR